MSRSAQEYVLSLVDDRLSRHHAHLLLVIAFYHQEARETWWPSHKTLAEKCHTDERQIRRMVAELVAFNLLTFMSGIGRGNRGSYGFPGMEKRTPQPSFSELKQDTKQDKNDSVIRRRQDLLQIQHLNPPYPPLQGGNKSLTARQLKALNAQIQLELSRHLESFGNPKWDYTDPSNPGKIEPVSFEQAVTLSCMALLLPADQAWAALRAAGFGKAKKLPESAMA